MSTYLIHSKGKGRLLQVNVASTTAHDFGRMQENFAVEANSGHRPKHSWDRYASMVQLDPHNTANGVYYDWGLAGPDGAWFALIALPGTSDDDIALAKRVIRQRDDVVRFYVVRIRKMI